MVAKLVLPWAARKIDVVSVGYPKTGNTWFSMLCRMLLVRHFGLPEGELADVLPDSVRALMVARKRSVPIVYVTHNMPWYTDVRAVDLGLSFDIFRGKKAIFLVREPKDTLVSLYMHAKYREGWYKEDIGAFVRNEYFGIEKYLAYYRQLHDASNTFAGIHIVRYEDLSHDTRRVLASVARFCGLQGVGEDTLQAAIEYGSIRNMRKMESEGSAKWWAMKRPVNVREPNAFKVRQGKVGGFAEHLAAPAVEHIDSLVRKKMPRIFGYGFE